MTARFLDEEARRELGRAVEAVETASSAEIVIAFRRHSDRYRHANIAVAVVAAFVALAIMLYADRPFSLVAILFDPFLVALLAAGFVELFPGIKRVLTPPARRRERVRAAARSTFLERGVHATRDRSGVLVYIGWLEKQIVLVADVGFVAAVPADAILAAEVALTEAMSRGGAAVGRVLAGLAPELGRLLPRRTDDVNELPDSIDSDEARS